MEIVYFVLLAALFAAMIIPGIKSRISAWKERRGTAPVQVQNLEEKEEEGAGAYDPEQVREILTGAMRSLQSQRAAGYGPWISGCLDGGPCIYVTNIDVRGRVHVERDFTFCRPAVALEAVRRTIRDILSVPASYDKDGREMPRRTFDLSGLMEAAERLEGMVA